MASNPEFVQYIADQLAPAGQVTYHKMFGDYGVYLDGKMFALVCDDQLFIKITKEGTALAPQLPKAPPYDGAKDYFLYEDVDDREHMIAFVQATCRELPMPSPKRRKERPDRCRLTIKRSIRNFISRPKSRSCWKCRP